MLIDILIILFLVSALVRGREIGFIRQLLSTAGFFGGLAIGVLLQPHLINLAHTTVSRAMLTLVLTLGFGIIFLSLGEYIGVIIKLRLMKHPIDGADVVLGAVAGGLTLVLTIWLVTPVLISLPFPGLQQAMKNSAIITELNKSLPSAPTFLTAVEHWIDPNGFPQVFIGLEPTPPANAPLPDLGAMNTAVEQDEASVIKIEGQGCGGIVEGSGFIAAQGYVITNAHVVAGIAHPYAFDEHGQHNTQVVWFDPNLDLAVLRVSGLSGTPLTIDASNATNGTEGAVLGYPNGGTFTAAAATIVDEFLATGRNIYGQGTTDRDVYELKATVIPGNSGGPLINTKGTVIGLVFAKSTTYNQVGYALAMQQVVREFHQAESQNTVVSTGSCAE